MLQKILNYQGVKQLNKNQQQIISGGGGLNSFCHSGDDCDHPYICAGCICRRVGDPV